jgi:nitroimidazol reductase NimA-like FMN-containing flavoprotein (pyridoxamine 5'-phosphate oxidase superfamily)
MGRDMPSNRRDLIRMTDDEMATFIEEQKSLQVACHDQGGSIHLSTLWFAVLEGRLAFGTYTRSQKILNLQRNDRVTLLLEDGLTYETLRGVMIKGRAVLHGPEDVEEVHRVARAVMTRNQMGVPEEHLEAVAAVWAAKRTVVIVEPETVISWDHTKLDGVY